MTTTQRSAIYSSILFFGLMIGHSLTSQSFAGADDRPSLVNHGIIQKPQGKFHQPVPLTDPSPIDSLIDQGPASHAFWLIQVRDDQGNVLVSRNADKVVRPASNLKMLTASAILAQLGPDYRFETTLSATGEQQENRWVGDLHVIGSGDPSIHAPEGGDPLFLFESWVQLFDSMGVNVIDGNLIGWNGRFDQKPYPKGWEWDDLTYYYAPEIDALSFNMNVVDLTVEAQGIPGSRPSIRWSPMQTPYVQFINEQQITPAGTSFEESYYRLPGTNTIYLRSTIPQGYIETEPLTVHRPAFFFMDTMKRWFEARGIRINGQTLVRGDGDAMPPGGGARGVPGSLPGTLPGKLPGTLSGTLSGTLPGTLSGEDRTRTVIATHVSEPLYNLVAWLLQESDNFYTEMLVKELAAEKLNTQGSTELGLQLIEEYLTAHGVDPNYLELRDGSGMAPATMIRLSDLNHYLHQVKNQPWFSVFYEALPVSGTNGTLEDRFHNSPVRNRFNGKTGFLTGVRSLSGYLTTKQGTELTLTIATNNYTIKTREIDQIHEQLLEFLYETF